MKQLVLIFAILLQSFFVSSAWAYKTEGIQPNGGGGSDYNPWPWGTECPFPWDEIEGFWKTLKPKLEPVGPYAFMPYYKFEITGEWVNGTKVISIVKYSETGEVLGKGSGYAPPDQKIVRAIILAESRTGISNHRVIVRAYRQKTTQSCGGELVTVLTTRSMTNEKDTDEHFVLNKVIDNTK